MLKISSVIISSPHRTSAEYVHPTQFHSMYAVHLVHVYDLTLLLHLLFCFTAHCFLVCTYLPLPVILFCFLGLSSLIANKVLSIYLSIISRDLHHVTVTRKCSTCRLRYPQKTQNNISNILNFIYSKN